MEYLRGDLDGGANSFDGYELNLRLQRFTNSHGVLLFLSVKVEDYDDQHPIFGKSREDYTYSALGILNLPGLFGNEHFFSGLLAGYSYRDSNIGFLNAHTFLGGVTLGYEY